MLTLETIREKLQDRVPSKVAKATGLHVNTVANIRDGKSENPEYATLRALSDYLAPAVATNEA